MDVVLVCDPKNARVVDSLIAGKTKVFVDLDASASHNDEPIE